MHQADSNNSQLDTLSRDLIERLCKENTGDTAGIVPHEAVNDIRRLFSKARSEERTAPIVALFESLKTVRMDHGATADKLDISRRDLEQLARKHQSIDEHGVTIGGRVGMASDIVRKADKRVADYLKRGDIEAPSGIQLWDTIQENMDRIRSILKIDAHAWDTYNGQIKNCIDSVEKLAGIIDLPADVVTEIARVTQSYRMRLTPYYASLIQPGTENDPVLLQSVPSGEMVDNVGIEMPPVAADHSPARLIDQFYPRVLTIKATNMCAMYCTHCLRIAHIGKKDRIYSDEAYEEALAYIRQDPNIRDVLVTGGDAFVLPNKVLKKILTALDGIDHIRMKRLGTRIPVTAPQRVDSELLDILAASNDKKPLRVVTQINTAQEITPVSRDAFRKISKAVSAVLNQAVLLKGINDTRIKMWKLCETIQESYVRPYYIFNCSYRNPQFSHFRVPIETGRDIVESMYGNISGDAIPRYIATAGGKIPLHRSNVLQSTDGEILLKKPWSGEEVVYPDADPVVYASRSFSFSKKDV